MAFQLSPGVLVVEKDFTSIVPAVATSTGAFAGNFVWGPVLDPTLITSENELVSRFGKPVDANAASFFTAANFLAYSNNMQVVRVDSNLTKNAVITKSGSVTGVTISNDGSGYYAPIVTFSVPEMPGGIRAQGTASVVAGEISNIVITEPGSGYISAPSITITDPVGTGYSGTVNINSTTKVVSSVTIVNGGSGYNDPSITFSAPPVGAGATFTITVGGGGTLNSPITVTNGGTNYFQPVLTFSAPPSGVTATGTATVVNGVITEITLTNIGSGYVSAPTITITEPNKATATGDVVINGSGVITSITITSGGGGYSTAPSATISDATGGNGFAATTSIALSGVKIKNQEHYTDNYLNGAGVFGEFAAKYPGTLGNSIAVSIADSATYDGWGFEGEFDTPPSTSIYAANVGGSNDELHIIVVDALGLWTGTAGSILEKFPFVSKASDARKQDGSNNYYRDVVNQSSKYIWWMDHPESGTNWGNAAASTSFVDLNISDPITNDANGVALTGGVDDLAPTSGQIQAGFALFANSELYDISLVPTGPVSATVAKYVIQNVVETRRDCVAFVSPIDITTGEVIRGVDAAERLIEYRNDATFNVSSSYAVLDSGYKYQYDRYNDVYRWVPLNGDIAGLCARTDDTNDPWWSPGGLNRGQIKNVVKLAFNPNKAERDNLYKNGINPVVSFPGQGIVLFGDKTLLAKPSAFDRINVRRLFIVLEKAIAIAAKYQLFEFNDAFTRAQFRSLVEPFLRDVQGRRGVVDFRVICDETNNTGEVIDRNEFIADIYIKPARSINFITLNFIAARTAVSFDELGG